MKLSPRVLRRMIIATIFLVVFFLFGYGTKQLVQPTPTCTDGVKNGEEEGVDCGLFACQNYCEPDFDPPEVVSTKILKAGDSLSGQGDYDFVAEIVNPNKEFGASEVVYELTLFNGNDEELLKREGIFYILPSQTKYLVITFLTTERNVTKADLKIKSAKWQKLDSAEGLNLTVRREQYSVSQDGQSSALDAVIFNDSDFEFESIDIDVVLRNGRGDIIAVNRSEIRTVLSKTERHFRVAWPFPIGERIGEVEIRPTTNIFENSNFIKSYGSEVQKFQQY